MSYTITCPYCEQRFSDEYRFALQRKLSNHIISRHSDDPEPTRVDQRLAEGGEQRG